jgi:hypothetical protein
VGNRHLSFMTAACGACATSVSCCWPGWASVWAGLAPRTRSLPTTSPRAPRHRDSLTPWDVSRRRAGAAHRRRGHRRGER